MTDRAQMLIREHRALDELFGRFLGASQAGAKDAACQAIRSFDDELRRHMAFEEESVLPQPAGHKLAPSELETEGIRLSRELRLEHVQIRELSGMIRRFAEEKNDIEGAMRLAPNLARRWDAHTQREERVLWGFDAPS